MMKAILLQQAVKFAKFFATVTACLGILSCEEKPITPPRVQPSVQDIFRPNELTRAIYSAHLQLDPHFVKAVADAGPVRDLFVGLMKFSPEGNVIPAIAKEHFSDDGKTWLFILDEQAKWSNGEAVTAQDFVASWQRLSDPVNHSPLLMYLSYMGVMNAKEIRLGKLPPNTLGVEALNSHTLKITLNAANFDLPKMLAHIALLPTYQGIAPSPDNLISNGSYQLESYEKQRLVLKANQTLPFEKVIYQLISTVKNPTRFDLIENPLTSYQLNERLLPRLCTYYYEFNFNDPYLSQKPIRQAIRAMISSSEISRDLGIANYHALPKTMSIGQARHLSTTSVEQLLGELGVESREPIRLTINYDEHSLHSKVAYRMARALGQSDLFRIHLQAVDFSQLLAKRHNQDFQLIRSGWCADYEDPIQFLMPFHSDSLDNKSGYKNAWVDQQLETLHNNVLNSEKRQEIIASIVHKLESDVAILPLFQYYRRISVAPDIIGIVPTNSSEVIYSKDLSRQPIDTIKDK